MYHSNAVKKIFGLTARKEANVMLAITAKVKLLKEEVFSAINVCKDIIGTLDNVTDNTNFKKEVGIFALQAPNWRILTNEKQSMQDLIRKVCTGEVSPIEARIKFEEALIELRKVDSYLQLPKK